MHEELVADGEELTTTRHDRIKVLRPGIARTWPEIWLPRLEACVRAGDVRGTFRLPPAYRPSDALVSEVAETGFEAIAAADPA